VKSRRDAAKFAANVRICPSDQAIAAVKSTRWQQISTYASAALQMKTAPGTSNGKPARRVVRTEIARGLQASGVKTRFDEDCLAHSEKDAPVAATPGGNGGKQWPSGGLRGFYILNFRNAPLARRPEPDAEALRTPDAVS